LATGKGKAKGGAPKANRNPSCGPRIGRERGGNLSDKPRGKPFAKGQNSRTGEVFRRGETQIPGGNFTLFAKCVYYDEREALYQRCVRIARSGTNREVLALLELLGNRIEGLPVKKVERTERKPARFIFANGEDALPERQSIGAGATPKTASPEDLVILGPELIAHLR
jgi:hypothetical protein